MRKTPHLMLVLVEHSFLLPKIQTEINTTYRPHIPDVIILNRSIFSFSNFVGYPAFWKFLKKKGILE